MARPVKEKRELKKVQMDLPPKSLERLQRLQQVTEAASYAEVVRNSLRLYEALIAEAEAGHGFFIEQDGKMVRFPIFAG